MTIFGEHGIMAHITVCMPKPIRALELHYPMIQFLIMIINPSRTTDIYQEMNGYFALNIN